MSTLKSEVDMSKRETWYSMDLGEELTHFCGGIEDAEKRNKPKGTQTEKTQWFNPATLDKETGVHTCSACGETHQTGDSITQVGG